jgi:hypothetical protein
VLGVDEPPDPGPVGYYYICDNEIDSQGNGETSDLSDIVEMACT